MNTTVPDMDNWTAGHHVDDPDFDIVRHPIWRGIMTTLFITVILLGLIGNIIVITIVLKNRNMQNVTNIFIANLALSDIGLCLLSLPVQLYYQLTDRWIFGEIMCKIIFAAFAVPMYVSTLTILLIATERYWLILYPLKKRMSKPIAMVLVVIVFLVSALLAIPIIMHTSLHIVLEPDLRIHRKYCIEQWPSRIERKVYSTSMFLLQFCLPICFTAGLYYRIYCRLRKRPQTTNQQNGRQPDHRQRTNKVLLAIVSVFIVCWLPWNIFSLLTELNRGLVRGAHYKFVDLLLKLFAMSSACINPFLYCWLNENFRKELDNIATKLKLQPRRSNSTQPPAPPAINVDYSPLAHSTFNSSPTSCAASSRTSITRLSQTRLSTTGIDLNLVTLGASIKLSNNSLDKENHKVSTINLNHTEVEKGNHKLSPDMAMQKKQYGNFLSVPM